MELEQRMDKLEQEQDKIKTDISELKTDMKLNTYKTDQVLSIVQKLENAIEDLKEKPAKNWDKVIGAIIVGVVGVVIGLIFK